MRTDSIYRALSLALLAVGVLAGCAACNRTDRDAAAAGTPAVSPADLPDDWRGRVVVADFWATWCGPCQASSPNVQNLHDTFAGDDKVLVVAVHADDRVEDPAAYLTEHRYTYPLVAKGQRLAETFGVNALPTFIILDAHGREVYRSVGMMNQATRDAIEAQARKLRG